MNCLTHPETPATAYCRTCGKPLCEECKRTAQGVIYCEEHAPAAAYDAPAAAPPRVPPVSYATDASPGLALALGFIPGVGAIYNGQYAKGLVHAVVFGLLVSIIQSGTTGGLEPLLYVVVWAWEFYMAIEAYHTARKRRNGEPVDEFSSLMNVHGRGTFPAGAVLLILLGGVLLMDTMGWLQFRDIARFWPVALILLGVYMLYARLAPQSVDGDRR
jgi:hypothetical protein